jgi:hypothetical protein
VTIAWPSALVHWALSAAPGLASWLSVAAAEALTSLGHAGVAVASGSIVAVVVVSTAPWPSPRFFRGSPPAIGWLAVFAVGVGVQSSLSGRAATGKPCLSACMVGVDGRAHAGAAALPLAVALVSMGAALFAIRRVSIPLEARAMIAVAVSVRALAVSYGRRLVFESRVSSRSVPANALV